MVAGSGVSGKEGGSERGRGGEEEVEEEVEEDVEEEEDGLEEERQLYTRIGLRCEDLAVVRVCVLLLLQAIPGMYGVDIHRNMNIEIQMSKCFYPNAVQKSKYKELGLV